MKHEFQRYNRENGSTEMAVGGPSGKTGGREIDIKHRGIREKQDGV